MNKIIGTAIVIGFTLVCATAMAGNGSGSGDGALRTFAAEKPLPKNPIFIFKDGHLVKNPDYNK